MGGGYPALRKGCPTRKRKAGEAGCLGNSLPAAVGLGPWQSFPFTHSAVSAFLLVTRCVLDAGATEEVRRGPVLAGANRGVI